MTLIAFEPHVENQFSYVCKQQINVSQGGAHIGCKHQLRTSILLLKMWKLVYTDLSHQMRGDNRKKTEIEKVPVVQIEKCHV